MLSREDLVTMLSRADTAWSTVQGVIRQWRRQDLATTAFKRHFDGLGANGWSMATLSATADSDDDPIIESILAVAVDRGGRRRRAHALSRKGALWLADTVVVNGGDFWARTGTSVMTNVGDPRNSYVGVDIVALLLPSAVPAGFDLTPTSERETVAGRPCVIAAASPHPPDAHGHIPGSEVFNMIAGGTDFRLSIDLQTGILLRVIKFVDGQTAELCEFTEITIDRQLDDSLFAPL
jgi:hypothetical protein